MKKSAIIGALGLAVLLAVPSQAQTIHSGWDLLNLPATTTTTATPAIIPATSGTVGTASIDISVFGLGTPQGTQPERTAFTGTATQNAFPGSDTTTTAPTQMALALANLSANGKSMIISLDMTGYQDLVLSLATRGTSTGFNTHDWAWSTDGVNYTSLISNAANQTSTWSTETVDFTGTGLDNAPTAYISLTVNGATGTTGNNRFDNILLNVSAIPEPTSLSLLGGFGLLAWVVARRRK